MLFSHNKTSIQIVFTEQWHLEGYSLDGETVEYWSQYYKPPQLIVKNTVTRRIK